MTPAVSSELHLVAAARPNLPKLAALWHALPAGFPLRPVLLHTGQHHDGAMFGAHLDDLGLPAPAIALGVSGGGHAALVGRTVQAAGEVWAAQRPALVVVAGDVDGSLAAGLAARKLAIPVAHLEAGLRCSDADMPEEVNRRALDAVATLLWAPDEGSAARLLREGHAPASVRAVGNAMVDTLLRTLPAARERPLPAGLRPGGYGVVTLHRAATVDRPGAFAAALRGLAEAARLLPFAWPAHPRARARMAEFGLAPPPGVVALSPLSYRDFLALLAGARLVATDSGGVQEEATALSLPCLTLRAETERPVKLEHGSSRLVAPEALAGAAAEALSGRWPRGRPIPLWDGRAGERMAAHILEFLGGGTGP
jgi:UDP-N-acetylglucosamine 2-epimerase (non-hydrolysing)